MFRSLADRLVACSLTLVAVALVLADPNTTRGAWNCMSLEPVMMLCPDVLENYSTDCATAGCYDPEGCAVPGQLKIYDPLNGTWKPCPGSGGDLTGTKCVTFLTNNDGTPYQHIFSIVDSFTMDEGECIKFQSLPPLKRVRYRLTSVVCIQP